MKGVLLLNASYEPLNVISVKRAFKLWALGKIEVLEESDQSWSSVFISMNIPLVVKLIRYVNHKRYIKPRLARRNVYIRDNFTCQWCGQRLHPKDLTLDHLHPRKHGGQTTWGNLVTSCRPCNQKKGEHTYKEAQELLGMELIRGKPRKPDQMLLTVRLKYGYDVPDEWSDYMYA